MTGENTHPLTDKERIIQRYDARLSQFGYDIRTLASGSPDRHRLRHSVLAEVGITQDSRVLDLGCGFGDFYSHLEARGLQIEYVGYDINAALLEVARTRHPGAEFAVVDVLEDPFPEFDYIVSSNVFNLRLKERDNYDVVADVMRICYRHARCGVAIDLLSSYVDFESAEGFHYKPERIFELAKSITKRVVLRHDYPLFEFCVYLYPDFDGWNAQRGTG